MTVNGQPLTKAQVRAIRRLRPLPLNTWAIQCWLTPYEVQIIKVYRAGVPISDGRSQRVLLRWWANIVAIFRGDEKGGD